MSKARLCSCLRGSGLEQREEEAGDRQFDDIGGGADGVGQRAGAEQSDLPGQENAGDQRYVEQKLEKRAEFDHRKMAAGIFENHRLMHHGEFEVRGGIVDRNARVLGERHHDERDDRHSQRHAQPDIGRGHEIGDRRKLGRSGNQRHAKENQQHRGLGKRCDHDFAAGADPAKAGTDIHSGERQKEARASEQGHDRDQVGGPVE